MWLGRGWHTSRSVFGYPWVGHGLQDSECPTVLTEKYTQAERVGGLAEA